MTLKEIIEKIKFNEGQELTVLEARQLLYEITEDDFFDYDWEQNIFPENIDDSNIALTIEDDLNILVEFELIEINKNSINGYEDSILKIKDCYQI